MIELLDVAPVGGGIGIFIAVAFFLVFCAAAFVAFKLLKRTVKMAVRIAVVGLILLVAVAGSVALFSFVATPSKPVRHAPVRP